MFFRTFLLAFLMGIGLTACGGGGGGSDGGVAVGSDGNPVGGPSAAFDLSGASRAAPPTMGALET